jgi:hypothetical protein
MDYERWWVESAKIHLSSNQLIVLNWKAKLVTHLVLPCCDMYEYMIHSIYSSFPGDGGREIL